jgi:type VI secretion system secreted protein Hcp
MPVDIFLKMDPIKGESKDSKHKDQIDIDSFSFGASQGGTFGSGSGGGKGKVSVQDLHLTHRMDAASSSLFQGTAQGMHYSKAILTVRKAGGKDALEYLKITLDDVLISSFQIGVHNGDEQPQESFSLNFRKITYHYTTQTEKGGAGSGTPVTWDVSANSE